MFEAIFFLRNNWNVVSLRLVAKYVAEVMKERRSRQWIEEEENGFDMEDDHA